MPDRNQERTAVELFIESVRITYSIEFVISKDNAEDFPDFILSDPITSNETWVEIVQAVESAELLSAERRIQRHYEAAAREYRARGEEVVLTVSPQGVESVSPSPGYGVTGSHILGPVRRISPPEWIAKAIEQKGHPSRYGPTERARTTLLIDCSREVLVEREDAVELRSSLGGNTYGFKEIWCVSANWVTPKALVLAAL
jgi:hypothetical protein